MRRCDLPQQRGPEPQENEALHERERKERGGRERKSPKPGLRIESGSDLALLVLDGRDDQIRMKPADAQSFGSFQ